MKIDFLVVGAHPDDAELGAGGFLHKMKQRGYSTGIVDLTRGELGSRGTPEVRAEESRCGGEVLGIDVRRNLDMGDGHLVFNLENRHKLAKTIREFKPTFLIAPYLNDKHPDHVAAGQITKAAFYDARMTKLELGFPPHSVSKVFYYPCHLYFTPSFVVDITASFSAKIEAVRAHKSQFNPEAKGPYKQYLPLGFSDYIFHTESRCRHFGSLINVCYAEGFICEDTMSLDDPHVLLPQVEKVVCG